MSNLQKETVDTLVKPEPDLTDELELGGSSNEFNQNQFVSGDQVDLKGGGVPAYETTGEVDPNDDIGNDEMENDPQFTG
ncbi:hypothetical protein [Legionella spiritensis]|uniref:Uncharacterized protein n=1 Tax=Legionella spiritensis TaxID=452 RepID=A0A0W0Z8M1_LEGSP|nr:hypothetical protein [Legionella spiritensis]KTD65343.1 hypothetical protein Lspi_0660 [Legionella spiritensis]SNV47387.1 Uncharacterised protein [Legionella spiritensis]VEG91287.1 Uncharacterised protein [Legionella spiritensis]